MLPEDLEPQQEREQEEQAAKTQHFGLEIILQVPQVGLKLPIQLQFAPTAKIEEILDNIISDFIENLSHYPVETVSVSSENETDNPDNQETENGSGRYVTELSIDPQTLESLKAHLQLIISGRGKEVKVNDDFSEIIQILLNSLQKRQTRRPRSQYSSKYPNQEKVDIPWNAPKSRKHNVYPHHVHCPYCNRSLDIKTRSPQKPATCGETECQQAHILRTAKERKQRSRQNKKR